MTLISGVITDPALRPVAGARIELRALNSAQSGSLFGSVLDYRCDDKGGYSFQLLPGYYDTYVQNDDCGDLDYLGISGVTSDTADGDIASILVDGGINITPPLVDVITEARDEAVAAAEEAKNAAQDAIAAADSIGDDLAQAKRYRDEAEEFSNSADLSATSAKDSETIAAAAATSASESLNEISDISAAVETNADAASTAAEQARKDAEQVSKDAEIVSSLADQARSDAGAAENSATEAKADAAKVHDDLAQVEVLSGDAVSAAGAAEYYAELAKQGASVSMGALIDAGEADLSAGVPPEPLAVESDKVSCFWLVTAAGTVLDVDYDVGDLIVYTSQSDTYYKVGNTHPGSLSDPILLDAEMRLGLVREPGFYYQPDELDNWKSLGYPTSAAFLLRVSPVTAGYIVQEAVCAMHSSISEYSRTYTRSLVDGDGGFEATWSHQLSSHDTLPTQDEFPNADDERAWGDKFAGLWAQYAYNPPNSNVSDTVHHTSSVHFGGTTNYTLWGNDGNLDKLYLTVHANGTWHSEAEFYTSLNPQPPALDAFAFFENTENPAAVYPGTTWEKMNPISQDVDGEPAITDFFKRSCIWRRLS